MAAAGAGRRLGAEDTILDANRAPAGRGPEPEVTGAFRAAGADG